MTLNNIFIKIIKKAGTEHIAMATKKIYFRGLPILLNKCTTFYLIMTSDV